MDIFRLSDEELWRGLKDLAAHERVLGIDAVVYVAETQRRRLHEKRGWPSMFDYCVQSLRWSEATAYRRTRTARAVLEYPVILEMLYDGRLHIEGVVILYAFHEDPDFASLLLKAVGMTTKNIERLVAERRHDPPARDSIRFVGVSSPPVETVLSSAALSFTPSGSSDSGRLPAEAPPPPVIPPPSKLVRVAFTADEELHRLVQHAQQLMRHKYPNGSLEGIFRDALRLLIEKKDLGVRAATAAARKIRRKNRGVSAAASP